MCILENGKLYCKSADNLIKEIVKGNPAWNRKNKRSGHVPMLEGEAG